MQPKKRCILGVIMSHLIKITTLICIVSGYLVLGFGIPLHMAHMSEHGMSMEDCPLFPFSQSGGDNTLYSHLSVWQSFALIFTPILFLLGWAYLEKKLHVFLQNDTWRLFIRNHVSDPPLRHLFSQGILHSKAP